MSVTTLHITVKPNAKQNAWTCTTPGSLAVRLKAKPVEGEANTTLLRFLAQTFNLPLTSLHLIAGTTSRHKRVTLPLSQESIRQILESI